MALLNKDDMIKFVELFKHGDVELNGRYLKFENISGFDIFDNIFKLYILRNQGLKICINEYEDRIEAYVDSGSVHKEIKFDISNIDDNVRTIYKFAKLSESITYTTNGVKLALCDHAYNCLKDFCDILDNINSMVDIDEEFIDLLYETAINDLESNSLFNDSAENKYFCALNRCT